MDEQNEIENDLTRAEDELYKIPEHLKVSLNFLWWLYQIITGKEISLLVLMNFYSI